MMKSTITALTLAIVLASGASFAHAGIIVTDRTEQECKAAKEGIIVTDFVGVLRAILGIIVTDKPISDGCKVPTRNGIIVTDRADGIIVTDRADGIIVTD